MKLYRRGGRRSTAKGRDGVGVLMGKVQHGGREEGLREKERAYWKEEGTRGSMGRDGEDTTTVFASLSGTDIAWNLLDFAIK
jgi:hypothetical protein